MDPPPAVPPEAAAFGISFDGRAYHYAQYSYDRLGDALRYAALERARPGLHEDPAPRNWKQWAAPTPEERLLMAARNIVFARGYYLYGPYRYDLLSAALDYARREPGLAPPAAWQGTRRRPLAEGEAQPSAPVARTAMRYCRQLCLCRYISRSADWT